MRLAGRQDNVIGLDQAFAAGMTRNVIRRRIESGQWQRMHRRVLLIGPAPPTLRARMRAAAMSVGPHCAVGLEAAAAMRRLRAEPAGPIDVFVSGRNARSRHGVIVHRTTLLVAEVEWIDGIPVTTVARTICDEAATLVTPELEQLLIDARVQRLVRDADLWAVIEHAPRRPGSARMRDLLREAELPLGRFNRYIDGKLVDCHWPSARLIVEVDGRRYHGHPGAFEEDRRRDQILVAAGWRVIRVTWRQLVNARLAVAARIAQALAHRVVLAA